MDEEALINQFKDAELNTAKKSPDIPNSSDGSQLHWTDVEFVMGNGWETPGKSVSKNANQNPSPWNDQKTPDPTWLWYGQRKGETNDNGPSDGDNKDENNDNEDLTLF